PKLTGAMDTALAAAEPMTSGHRIASGNSRPRTGASSKATIVGSGLLPVPRVIAEHPSRAPAGQARRQADGDPTEAGNSGEGSAWPARQRTEAGMASHKFKIGQLVNFAPSRSGMPTSGRQYEVVRLLPPDARELQYMVKYKGDTFARVDRE